MEKIDLHDTILKFDANEPGKQHNDDMVYFLERIYNEHVDKNKRGYKLLGMYIP